MSLRKLTLQEGKSFIISFDRSYNENKLEQTAEPCLRQNRQMVKSFRWLLTCGLRSIRICTRDFVASLIATEVNESLCSIILLYPVLVVGYRILLTEKNYKDSNGSSLFKCPTKNTDYLLLEQIFSSNFISSTIFQ